MNESAHNLIASKLLSHISAAAERRLLWENEAVRRKFLRLFVQLFSERETEKIKTFSDAIDGSSNRLHAQTRAVSINFNQLE